MKKTISRFLLLLLAETMVLMLVPSLTLTVEAEDKGDITVTAADGVTVTFDDVSAALDAAGVDDSADTYSITISGAPAEIGWNAFNLRYGLTSVTIPASVEYIDNSAFDNCKGLTALIADANNTKYSSDDGVLFDKNKKTIVRYPCGKAGSYTIPVSVETIGDTAFYGCDQLTDVTIPDSVTTIERHAFANCDQLASVVIPDSVNTISDSMFAWCDALASVTIPDSVTSIGKSAFEDCASLTSLTIPALVTYIGEYAFENCASLIELIVDAGNSDYSSADGVLFDYSQETLLRCPSGKSGSYTIPNSVKTIGETAFSECTGLHSVTIPDSATSIGKRAFNHCISLTSVNIPPLVTSIGERVFEDCSSLTAITVDGGNSKYSSADGVLFDKSKTTLIACPGKKAGAYSIPYGVVALGATSFYSCSSLTSVTISDSVTSIGDMAFASCKGLTSMSLPASVTSIGEYAFAFCPSLVNIYMWPLTPPNVKSLNSFQYISPNAVIHVQPSANYSNPWQGVPVKKDLRAGDSSSGGSYSSSRGGTTTYTITFETGGGSTVKSQSIKYNGKGKEPAIPTKEGFAFAGWYADKELTEEYDFSNAVTSRITIYAKWTELIVDTPEHIADIPEYIVVTPEPEWENPFVDVNESDWFYRDVEYAHTSELFSGTTANTFSPNEPMTRAMLVTVLWRMDGCPSASGTPFTDAGRGLWYSEAVAWVSENGLANGIGGGLFAPDTAITREQTAQILFNYAKVKGAAPTGVQTAALEYTDADKISDWAVEGVMFGQLNGIIKGNPGNLFDPQGTATRAEVAAMLCRFLELAA